MKVSFYEMRYFVTFCVKCYDLRQYYDMRLYTPFKHNLVHLDHETHKMLYYVLMLLYTTFIDSFGALAEYSLRGFRRH